MKSQKIVKGYYQITDGKTDSFYTVQKVDSRWLLQDVNDCIIEFFSTKKEAMHTVELMIEGQANYINELELENIKSEPTINDTYRELNDYINGLNLRHDISVVLEIIEDFIKVKILENGSFRSQFYSFESDFNDVLKIELKGLIDNSPKIELVKFENGKYKTDINDYNINILKVDQKWVLTINSEDYPCTFKTKKEAFNHALYIL